MSELRLTVDYTRKSLDKAGTEDGVNSQHEENADFADTMNIGPISRTYTDNDISAYKEIPRPAYQKLIADMKAGKIGIIIVWHAKRLHRRVDEVTEFIKIARQHHVRLFSVSRGGEYALSKAGGRRDLINDTNDGEHESSERGERVALARKRQARRGDHGGGIRPFGWGVDTGRVIRYCVNPQAPSVERIYAERPVLDMTQHHPEEAAEIRRMADDLLAGVKMAAVIRDLNTRGVRTVYQKDGRHQERTKGRPVAPRGWCDRTIIQILTHPRVSGHSVYRGEIIARDIRPAIIPEDTRQALITLFADPARKTSPGNTPKWLGSLIYQCAICDDGTSMTVRNDPKGRPTYRCRVTGHNLHPALELDEFIGRVMIARLSRPDLADLLPQRASVDVTALREELRALQARRTDAARKFALTKIDDEAFDTIMATSESRLAEIRAELETAATEVSPLAPFLATDDAQGTWNALSLGRKREIIKLLITVRLSPAGRGRRISFEDRARTLIEITEASPLAA